MIQDGHTGVLTGGWSGGAVTAKVTRYNRTGMQEPLPTLITARGLHGCSSLVIDGKKVRIAHGIVSNLCYTTPAQTYLVVGGVVSSSNLLASTEMFSLGEAAWKQVGPLPVAVWGLRATTVANLVYAAGKL